MTYKRQGRPWPPPSVRGASPAFHFDLDSRRVFFFDRSMKFKVLLMSLLLSAASAAPVAQDIFLIPSEPIPPVGYNSDAKLFWNLIEQQQRQQLGNVFLPAEHRVEPVVFGQVKPGGSTTNENRFTIHSAGSPLSGVPVALNLQPTGQEGNVLIPLSGVTQPDSKEAPAAVKLAIAVPAVSQATRLTITIDIQPSGGTQNNAQQSSPVVSAAAPGSAGAVSVDSSADPDKHAGITVEAAPIIEVPSFPNVLASPPVDEDDLSNRNPDGAPSPVAPGGIVQSGQPDIVSVVFQNSKDSPYLTELLADAQAQSGTRRQ